MTRGWSILPERPRRRRRVAIVAGLVAVFAASAAAGWAVADPGSFGGAIAVATGGRSADPAATASPAAMTPAPTAPTGTPPAAASPSTAGTSAPPVATPTPAATTAPTPSATPIAGPTSTVSTSVAARLDRALARATEQLLLPGVEATVTFPDGSSWTGTLGMADVADGRKVRASTPFAIASVTKTFTSALILRYVDDGLLRLDQPLSRWFPDWPDADRITIRMLLNHTSGIPDFFRNSKFERALNKAKKREWSPEDVLAGYVRPGNVFEPGTGWSYSNTNYVLLGMVAEKIGGAPWEDLVHRELIDPLGLTSTYVQAVDAPPAAPALAYNLIYGEAGRVTPVARTDGTDVIPFTSVVTAAGAAGAMASNTEDLARWARALYGGDLLSAATRKQLLTFVRAYAYGLGTSYGLGASRVRFEGRPAYGHTGALAGTRASIRYFPKDGVAVAVLFNRETYVGDDVVRYLARALFPAAPASPSPGTSPGPSGTP